MLKMMTNKVAINHNVFGALVENIVMSDVDSTSIVTVNRGTSDLRDIHIS